ncbi:MAG: glycyl-radical enzyme activating protein [Elusimicrobia bacterium]|nr:glycyl-radical enzyme activating protein [Elusimicrobiota bacterium]
MIQKGTIFDIQGFSVHDGPGCRTTIFLKGCPLNCKWCCNPEGIAPYPEILFYKSKCAINDCDGECIESCPNAAIIGGKKSANINTLKCGKCNGFACVSQCYYDAIKISGINLSAEELMKKIRRDRQYWGAQGGMTLSGGEPLSQIEFTAEILKKCHDAYIHTAIETCGYAPWKSYERILDYTDWIFFDIKHMDSAAHEKETGLPNDLILENAKKIAASGKCRLIFRMPLISGFNDSRDNIIATADFISNAGTKEVNILPFHNLGRSKYSLLGKEYHYKNAPSFKLKDVSEIKKIFQKRSIKCYPGSETPF